MPRSSLPAPVLCCSCLLPPLIPAAALTERQHCVPVGQQLPLVLHLILHERHCIRKSLCAPHVSRSKYSQLQTSAVGNPCFPPNRIRFRNKHSHDRPVRTGHRCHVSG